MSDSPNPFSNDALKSELDKLPEHGGEVDVHADKSGVDVEADVAVTKNWSVGGWVRSTWNGAVDFVGVSKIRW